MNCSAIPPYVYLGLYERLFNIICHICVQNVNKLKSNVYLTKNERVVNMKSILGILSVGCNQGDKVKIACLNKEKSEADEDMNIVKRILESGGM